jgi:hypothetical protein
MKNKFWWEVLPMDMAVINIPLDAELAQIYEQSSTENQQKIQLLLTLWLREMGDSSSISLSDLMDAISDRAQAQGLTPELLDELLNDD